MGFLAELKRRNVIRMAGLYLVGAWLVVQVAATLLPVFEAPGWVMKVLVGVLAIGFVAALAFSWLFELTPEGLKRDAEVPASESIAPQTAQRMNRMLLGLLLLALTFFVFDRFVLSPKREAASVASALQRAEVETAITDKSIAVLPFVDMSQAKDQEWFGDGLAEEILNALARTPDLRVSARTSSFRYKGSNLAVPQIARELGVAHVLEGSIRSTPQRIRVTAQLIRASDGFHLWSQSYDRDPSDMIEIQEDLARSIATAMQTSMDPKALTDMAAVGTRSVEAYQAYIRGVSLSQSAGIDTARMSQSYQYLEKARALDPAFAAAHSAAARFWQSQMSPTSVSDVRTGLPFAEMAKNFEERIQQAIEHATTPASRLQAEASAAMFRNDWRKAIRLYEEYLAGQPGDLVVVQDLLALYIQVHDQVAYEKRVQTLWPLAQKQPDVAGWYVRNHFQNQAHVADQATQLLKVWPDLYALQYQAHRAFLWVGRIDAAATVLASMQGNAPNHDNGTLNLARARQACAEGRRSEVEDMLRQTDPANIDHWHLLELLGKDEEAAAFLKRLEQNGYGLTNFLLYPQFDPRPFPALMQILAREKVQRPPPVPLPFACPPAGAGAG